VTYQIWAWFEAFEGTVNRTNTVSFDAHWTSGAKKRGFEISLATDSNRLVVKFLPPKRDQNSRKKTMSFGGKIVLRKKSLSC